MLIDPYCDEKALAFLSHKKSGVNILIYLSHEAKLSNEEECYDLGTSLNYAGNKMFTITKIESKHIIKAILNEISE